MASENNSLSASENSELYNDKQICEKCGGENFRVYVSVSLEDARVYCSSCNYQL